MGLLLAGRHEFCLRQILQAPVRDSSHQSAQCFSPCRQGVFNPAAISIIAFPDNKAEILETFEPRREDVRGNAFLRRQELVKTRFAQEKVAHDEQAPSVPNQIQRAGYGTIRSSLPASSSIAASHATTIQRV